MVKLRTQFRHLYLLALFQLVGGPLVLLPLLMMTGKTVKETAHYGLVEGLHRAAESPEWQAAREVLLTGAITVQDPDSKIPAAPEKARDGKLKLYLAVWTAPAAVPLDSTLLDPPQWRWLPMASAWAHAPPIPPPRVA